MRDNNLSRRIVREARRWVGTPYLHQASVKDRGCDCLGLVRGIWRHLHGDEPQNMPNYSPDWGDVSGCEAMLEAANKWFIPINIEDAQAGDLLLFRWNNASIIKHAGIRVTQQRFIHAYEKTGVVETTLGSHWQKRIAAAFAFPTLSKFGK